LLILEYTDKIALKLYVIVSAPLWLLYRCQEIDRDRSTIARIY